MSIRVEDASRFSLRTSLLGEQSPVAAVAAAPTIPSALSPFVIAPPQHHPQQHASPTSAPAAAARSLTFKNLLPSQAAHAAVQAANAQAANARTAHALASIAAAQKRAAPLPLVATRPSADGRVLPSGFVSGGSANAGAQAEVMRLTAKLDALQSQMAAQSERLAKTEASLVRANRTMTSERATANGRLLRMQTELTDLRSKEAKLREQTATRIFADPSRTQSNFESSVKRVQEFDAKISSLTQSLANLSAERDALTKRLQETSARADGSATVAAERGVQLQTLQDEHAHLLKSRDSFQQRFETTSAQHEVLAQRLQSVQTEAAVNATGLRARMDELAARLATAKAERDAATSARAELQEALDAAAAATAATDAAAAEEVADVADVAAAAPANNDELYNAACAHIETLNARVDALASENEALQKSIDALAAPEATDADATDADAAPTDAAPTDMMDLMDNVASDVPSAVDAPVMAPVDAPVTAPVAGARTVVCAKPRRAREPHRLAAVFGKTTAFGAGIPRARLSTPEDLLTSVDASGTDAAKTPPHPDVKALFEAISADVRASLVQQRARYLRASGLDDMHVAMQMLRFS